METATLRVVFVWATTTTSSSSSPVVLVLVSSVVTIPMTVPLIKTPKAVLRSSPETILTAALINGQPTRTLFFSWTSSTGQYLIHVVMTLINACTSSKGLYETMNTGISFVLLRVSNIIPSFAAGCPLAGLGNY